MTAPAQVAEVQYKYRGELVSILDSTSANLWQVARADGNPFWVRAEKLKLVKPPRRNYHNIPAIGADPFVVWLLTQKVWLRADCPPRFFAKLSSIYEKATGEVLHKVMPGLSVRDADKSWTFSLYVDFPRPPADLVAPFNIIHNERHTRTPCCISCNEFVVGLLALGLRFGSNQPLQAQQ